MTGKNEQTQNILYESDPLPASDLSGEQVAAAKKGNIWQKCWKFRGLGMICAFASAVSFSVGALLLKLIDDVHPIQLGASRTSLQFLILLPFMFYKRNEIDVLGSNGLKRYLWLRGINGSCAVMFLYLAVGALDVGNAITISYLSMVMVPFLARVFLKESLTILDAVFAVISLTGVVLIAQPPFLFPSSEGQSQTNGLGVLCAVISAVLQSMSIIIIRKLGKETPPFLNMLYYSFCGAIIMTIVLSVIQEFRFPYVCDLLFIFMLGILGILGQYFLTLSLQLERAGTVGVLRSSQIIVVYILQVTVLGNIPSTLSLVGAALVFSCSIGIGVRKIANERKRRNSVKNS